MSKTIAIFIFFISNALFPALLVGLMIFLKRKCISTWKAWAIASTCSLLWVYLLGRVIGEADLWMYLMIFLAALPSIVLGKEIIPDNVTSYFIWILPPLVFIIIPSSILFFRQKRKIREKDC